MLITRCKGEGGGNSVSDGVLLFLLPCQIENSGDA